MPFWKQTKVANKQISINSELENLIATLTELFTFGFFTLIYGVEDAFGEGETFVFI